MDTPLSYNTLLPDPVLWSEGMLLSPQHLQQNDVYWNAHLRHRLAQITPHYWGVSRIAVDPSALVSDKIIVTELECILPDGHAIEFPGRYSPAMLEADVSKLVKGNQRTLRIWLQVYPRNANAAVSNNSERRYDTLSGVPTADENLGYGDVPVPRLQTRLALHADYVTQPPPFPSSACPLFDVAHNNEGRLCITGYHPPMLQIQASDFQKDLGLQHRAVQLMHRIWSKLETLAGEGDSGDEGVTGPHLLAARALAMALPQLEIAAVTPFTHPADLYKAIAHVVGHVACLGTNPVPIKMKPYRHDDCMPLFEQAFDYIDARLKLIDTVYERQPFSPIDVKGFAQVRFARLWRPDASTELVIELKAREGQNPEKFTDWLREALIVSDTSLSHALEARVCAGYQALSKEEAHERGLRPNTKLFYLKNNKIPTKDGRTVDAILPDQLLMIHGPQDDRMPAAIYLHRRKHPHYRAQAQAASSTRPEESYA